jgi:tRNA modification GTPase
LLDQYWGACNRALADILTAWDAADAVRTSRLLKQLALLANVGRHLTDPWRVVIAGAPNVGKSSLINALVGYHRCIVSPTAGTTRDLVTTLIALDGWPIELFDTAGLVGQTLLSALHDPAEDLERQGMLLTRKASAAADLCIWVFDASAPPIWPDFQTENMRFVINKVDLAPAWDWNEAAAAVRISALNAIGLDKLSRLIAEWLVPVPPSPGAGVPFEPGICALVENAWQHYTSGDTAESRRILDTAFRTISRS